MLSVSPELVWLIFGTLAGLTVLAVLRVLSSYRAHAVEQHEILCEVRRLRNQYLQRRSENE